MAKITPKNCKEKTKRIINKMKVEGDYNKNMSAAWLVILKFCRENGMDETNPFSAIENVIAFISQHLKP